jgi:hypothetical protein
VSDAISRSHRRPADAYASARRPFRLTGLVGIAGACLLGLVVLVAVLSRSPPSGTGQVQEAPSVASPPLGPPASPTHVNELGGYSFEPPAGWAVRDRGSASELTSPDGSVVITFGSGRQGSLGVTVDALLDSFRRIYADVQVEAVERTSIHRWSAVVASGELRNAADTRVRFIGIALRRAGVSRIVAVFVAQPVDPAEVLPVIDRVVGSFEAA